MVNFDEIEVLTIIVEGPEVTTLEVIEQGPRGPQGATGPSGGGSGGGDGATGATGPQGATGPGGGGLSFLYDPEGSTNTSPIFNDWGDLMTAVDEVRYLRPTIYLRSTVPDGSLYGRRLIYVSAGEWDFTLLRFYSADTGGVTLYIPTGATTHQYLLYDPVSQSRTLFN